MSRKAPQLRGILWLYGKSGAGKGMVKNLLHAAFGRYAATATLDMLERRQGDIDAEMADLLERDPFLIACDELGGTELKQRKFYALTGNTLWKARRPYGRTIERVLRALWLAPTVNPPRLNAADGLERRSAVIGFERKYDGGNPNEDFDEDELAAAVTSAIVRTKAVFKEGYKAPKGNMSRRQQLIAESDPAQAWIVNLPDDYVGKTTEAAWKDYLAEGDSDRTVALNVFGKKVNASERWETFRPGRGKPMTMRLRPETLPGIVE